MNAPTRELSKQHQPTSTLHVRPCDPGRLRVPSSPFTAIPESQWVASNDLAFAIRDRHAVSPGHFDAHPRRAARACPPKRVLGAHSPV